MCSLSSQAIIHVSTCRSERRHPVPPHRTGCRVCTAAGGGGGVVDGAEERPGVPAHARQPRCQPGAGPRRGPCLRQSQPALLLPTYTGVRTHTHNTRLAEWTNLHPPALYDAHTHTQTKSAGTLIISFWYVVYHVADLLAWLPASMSPRAALFPKPGRTLFHRGDMQRCGYRRLHVIALSTARCR